MEILALKMLVTEKDLNDAAAQFIPLDEEIRKVSVRLAPEGVFVSGIYHMMINVSFETRWELAVTQGMLSARLADFKAMGMPAMLFQGMLMKLIREAVEKESEIHFDKDTIRVDVDRLLATRGFALQSHLSAVHCQAGLLTIEAGTPSGP